MDRWYKIQNKTNKTADVLIYEQIGKSFWDDSGVGAKDFVTDLRKLDVDRINLSINSPGGSVFEGNTIYNALKAHKAKVHVRIDGIAASIASVIAMAGDVVEMPENAMMMIHDPWGYAMGDASSMRKQAEALDKIKVGLVAAYRGKTGMDESEIADLMSDETWMTAEEAVSMGFADKMLAPVEAQANFNMLADFRKVPAQLKAGFKTGKDEGESMEQENTPKSPDISLETIKDQYPAIVEALLQQGRAEGADAERNRIKAVHEQSYPGHEALVNAAMFDGRSDAGAVAIAVLAAQKSQLANMAGQLAADAPEPVIEVRDSAPGQPQALSFDEQCKADWDNSADVRAEFGDFQAFIAYKTAFENGHVKVLGGKK